ncbi:MAG: protein arginine kinase [Acetomicrobium sp.]|nr:protein arginine kinase [Acetomicrobium sp.]
MARRDLLAHPIEWVKGKGSNSNIAVSSRIRLARNLSDFPFTHRCDHEKLYAIVDKVKQVISDSDLLKDSDVVEMDALDSLSRWVLVEKHLISPPFAGDGPGRVVIVDSKGVISIMVNEEDHLRIQVILSGLELNEVWRIAKKVEMTFEKLDYAFDSDFGYLTACPTNVGTGMRASVMVHIPALEMSKQIATLINECNRIGLTVRGTYGEGSDVLGSLYQISNQITLGLGEEELIDKVASAVRQIVTEEERARAVMKRKLDSSLDDRLWRAFGVMRYCRNISTREALELISLIKMGSDMEITPKLSVEDWNNLVLGVQPNHVQLFAGKELTPDERDVYRAAFLRERLKSIEPK